MREEREMGASAKTGKAGIVVLLLAVALLALALPANASAAIPEQLWQSPEEGLDASGPGAGQLYDPFGLAVDPDTARGSHVFVGDVNSRVSEFTTWGFFVRAFGWGVRDGSPEMQICTAQTGCRAGNLGAAPGQFGYGAAGMAVDSEGNLYATEVGCCGGLSRIQKFDLSGPEPTFAWMVGGEVDKTKVQEREEQEAHSEPVTIGEADENLCTASSGDQCGAGTEGTGEGQFAAWAIDPPVAAGPQDHLYVGDKDRVQVFDAEGHYIESISVSGTVESLAVDPEGDLYLTVVEGSEVQKLDPSGALLATYAIPSFDTTPDPLLYSEIDDLGPIALNPEGDLYAVYDPAGYGLDPAGGTGRNLESEVVEFGPAGEVLIGPGSGLGQSPPRGQGEVGGKGKMQIQGLATSPLGDLYASNYGLQDGYLSAFGPSPISIEAPPPHPPEIGSQYAAQVGTTSAAVGAAINPHFWPDTTYRVEYGPAECPAGCGSQTVEKALTSRSTQAFLGAAAQLTGLAPATTYHYRFIAESSGGGPTRGLGEGEDGPEGTFATFPLPPPPNAGCANQAYRSGASAALPDCRAYEMVSPPEKNNSDVFTLGVGPYDQSADSGDGFAYRSLAAFGRASASAYANQYLATRTERGAPGEGWSNANLTPPHGLPLLTAPAGALIDGYRAFSADLSEGWLVDTSDLTLDPAAPAGFAALYRRRAGGSYEALTTGAPRNLGFDDYLAELQAVSADGRSAALRANDALTEDAPNLGNAKAVLYLADGGQLHLASIQPNGHATSLSASAGTANTQLKDSTAQSAATALSADGSRLYFSTASTLSGGPGALYVRLNPTQPQSPVVAGPHCTEPAKACTVRVAASEARFLAATPDGSRALYLEGEKLRRFDLSSEASTTLVEGVKGFLGAATDLSRSYLLSTLALSGEGAGEGNSEGAFAEAGKPNLYLYRAEGEGGSLSFVATLGAGEADASSSSPSVDNFKPSLRDARLSPDGAHLAFMSSAPLTGYGSGGAQEVYRYSPPTGSLLCVSCRPSGAAPGATREVGGLASAALIPTWRTQLYASRALSADGSRVFFDSFDSLLPADTNGAEDVYEWEAPGSGDCDTDNSNPGPLYFAPDGGCLALISSGRDPGDSEFLDASADGSDVFMLTGSSLVAQDSGLIDVYDARVLGGFPPPAEAAAACEGEACQSPPPAPQSPTPASAAFHGPGNVKRGHAAERRRCGKGKRRVRRKGKVRCVKRRAKHRKRHHHHHHHKRRHKHSRPGELTMRKRLTALALALALLGIAAAPAQASFGVSEFDVSFNEAPPPGSPLGALGPVATQAGAHPYSLSTDIQFNTHEDPELGEVVDAQPKDIFVTQPEGFAGSPLATERCSNADFVDIQPSGYDLCPDASAVGTIQIHGGFNKLQYFDTPVYSLQAPPGAPAKFGFIVALVPVSFEVVVDEQPPYALKARLLNTTQVLQVAGSELTLWGDPGDESHDPLRGRCLSNVPITSPGEYFSTGNCPTSPSGVPLITMPRTCAASLATSYEIDSWQEPAAWLRGSVAIHDESGSPAALSGCERLGLVAGIAAKPTSVAAQSPSGLDFSLDVSNPGLTNDKPGAVSGSDIEKTVVTLPEGMTVNPSQAEGLEACTEAQLAGETAFSAPGAGCPQASKIGTIEVQTPLLDETVDGALYVAEPYHNLAGDSLIAVYVVLKSAKLGIRVVQPLKVTPNPSTGRLETSAEDMPQLPFSHFRLHFREGARAPLITPPGCGSFDTTAVLYPYSGNAPVTSTSTFQIIAGPNGGACPGSAPFSPGFQAGTENNAAGSYSPFDMRLTRGDGEQDMGKFSFVLPPGVVPKLAGIPYCSDAAIVQARSRQGEHGGQEELDSPSCPAASEIGTTLGGAGVGSQLTYVPGKLYLAGPYNGDPISAVAIVPAVAGPFDAGTIVVREALRLNPVTHVGEVDGSASDPIPHILKGIPLNVREVRVSASRPEFTLNPTSCEPFAASSTIWGDGTALEPLPEHPVELSSRFQAAGCATLGFKPKLGLKLKGGTKRGKFPALHAVYTPKPGDANLSRLALTFPKSEFIEQGHFRTICTRVQFAAGQGFGSECPKGSVYGHIKVWTPLLSEPLEGPVYLRSSNHNLPDAVFALHGLVDIELATRIDSTHGRLRAIVADSPDAPVSRAVVDMQGGQKGLFVNSTNLCVGKHRARANAGGQNGRRDVTKPVLRAVKCKKHRVKRHGRHHKKRAHKRSRR